MLNAVHFEFKTEKIINSRDSAKQPVAVKKKSHPLHQKHSAF
jgi:PHD/YefM family antitoxin component YafN of YafNO toxin-antitoxin module